MMNSALVRRVRLPLPSMAKGGFYMEEKRIAVLSVIVENRDEAEKLNACLSEFGEYIVGRMGIPYREKHVSVLCVVLDAPVSVVNALTGRIGSLNGVTAKTLFSKF